MLETVTDSRSFATPLSWNRETLPSTGLKWVARMLQEPFYRISEPTFRTFTSAQFSSQHLIITTVFFRFVGSVLLLTTSTFAIAGSLFYKAGDLISGKPFTYIKGNQPEIQAPKRYKMLTLNACMLSGGLPYFFGGLPPARERMNKIAQLIKRYEPDVVVMQEMAHGPSVQLAQKLKKKYSHFFTRIGPNPPLMESGLFVASKVRVLNTGFIPFKDQFKMIRGAFWIETENAVIFTGHLEHGADESSKRREQLNQILAKMKDFDKPCYLLGDLNIDRLREGHYERIGIDKDFIDYLPKGTATCSESLGAVLKGEPLPSRREEQVDYALLKRGEHRSVKCRVEVIETYTGDDPYTALSDHKALLLEATQRF